MNKYLREKRKLDEFGEDIYSEGYLEEADDELSDEEKWFMLGYINAEGE